ncbi:hypothetical protein ACOSP7_032155 [Xanthoceras sorbifolium]
MCFKVDVVDPLVKEVFRQTYLGEPLEACITHGATKEDENPDIVECALRLDSAAPNPYGGMSAQLLFFAGCHKFYKMKWVDNLIFLER